MGPVQLACFPMKEQGKEMSARSGIGDPFLNLVGKTRYQFNFRIFKSTLWKMLEVEEVYEQGH